MVDFVKITAKLKRNGIIVIYPKWLITQSSDLMIRGGDFYAVWLDAEQRWSTNEHDVIHLIDRYISDFAQEYCKNHPQDTIIVNYMWDAETKIIDSWHHYCQHQLRDNFYVLDQTLIFSNSEPKREQYASKTLPYSLTPGDTPSYTKLMSVLYTPEELHKLEWAVGAILCGDSKSLQKFIVLYGSQGSGKSTFLHIVEKLFQGYYTVFDAKALGSANNAFALEPFSCNPLVAIQHDGDLSHIEDNTRLNSLVSHELMTVNEKHKHTYPAHFNTFLFMGTNKPVKITDAKSGLIRRLIDVSPSGEKVSVNEYNQLVNGINFEIGAIAAHCLEVYKENPSYYDNYIPISMLGASNDFYNFVMDNHLIFRKNDGTTLKQAWELYKGYCEDARVAYPLSQRVFKEELKNYFKEFEERSTLPDGTRVRNWYKGFREDKFNETDEDDEEFTSWLHLDCEESILDSVLADMPAQYANKIGTPASKWDEVKTKLSDINTKELHYVKLPLNHIVIDFDIKENSEKSFKKNLEAATTWPPTYAELSKSGAGLHLHYFYTGDPEQLSCVADDNVEIKTFPGNSALRRMLSKCNNLPIATISGGLPVKEKKVLNKNTLESEKQLRALISKNLKKEIHPATKPSIDFIAKLLDDAYKSGMKYDVEDLHNAVVCFAANSTNQSDYCLKVVAKMKFHSDEPSQDAPTDKEEMIFFDVEVFPNLFVLCYMPDKDIEPISLINPSSEQIEELMKYKLVGFNVRRYDNHILYARLLGYSNEQLYDLSQKIINSKSGDRALFREAYNISYTDIYDFASAGNKMSLKKLEIKMGQHHQELGLPWDKPVDEKLWPLVADYCKNDVRQTRNAFHYLSADWTARQILADLAGGTVNETTNTLSTRFIFGSDRNPQREFGYRNLAEPVSELPENTLSFLKMACPNMVPFNNNSILPYFPGYTFEKGVSKYKGYEVGEGGFVYAEPGAYGNVALLDIASMHPHSMIAECLFGIQYTTKVRNLVESRVCIKHGDWEHIPESLRGLLQPYILKVENGEITKKDLSNALKTVINSLYGLTAANFTNPCRDFRNVDNIVAKRGALFMVDLLEYVKSLGYTVVHIKTDSIKIADADNDIIEKVMAFGRAYGYTFEHEATYEKMCLVNDAVYIAKYKDSNEWTATGTQFKVPYVFKQLFSHEEIEFSDLCETKSVNSALYLDMNEDLPEEQHNYQFIGKVGSFCPIKPGCGGGLLLRSSGEDKYAAVGGSLGYRWLEEEQVVKMKKQNDIDRSYYQTLVNEAKDKIQFYVNSDWFCSDAPYTGEIPDGLPF